MSSNDRPIYKLDEVDFVHIPESFFTMPDPWLKDDLVMFEEVDGNVEIVNVSFQARQKTRALFDGLHK